MLRHFKGFVALLVLILMTSSSAVAIQRVSPRLYVVNFYGGHAAPLGTYDGIVGLDFDIGRERVEFDADNVYDNGFHLGASYGMIKGGHLLMSVGIHYIQHDVKNPIRQTIGDYVYSVEFAQAPTLKQYDLDVNVNYLFMDLNTGVWSPYFGGAVSAGMSSASYEGYDNEYEAGLALGFNFGADFKLWSAADNRSFVTLSSVNSWNLVASGDRPRYLHIGAGVKYYFRP